ncbi:MAG: HipA domain-containing protein [Tatlockia sp.]|nr:HipA domain-containing protein [Tatlockia sp.]
MKRCPISYEPVAESGNYSKSGLNLLSPKLGDLQALELSADEQRKEAISRVGKMSIQGVQTKLSAQLKITEERFELVDHKGHFILKPQSEYYPELPENEAITMTLAATLGLEVPVHGLVYSKDQSMTYFIKRFDRIGKNKKLALEDFAQLSGHDRHTKYKSSMENVIFVIANFCTFPKIEFLKLFKLTLFNYLIGNEDMHLKNFSLITKNQIISLSPMYDLLNSSIAFNTKEELALPLNGKKSNLRKKDFIDYFAVERLGLNQNVINKVLQEIKEVQLLWKRCLSKSFLSPAMQEKYTLLLDKRFNSLGL